jgi:hypothetical protein
MELKEYFETVEGFGVLATADDGGRTNAAVYSRPHVMEDGQLAFIMRDRLTHNNVTDNPHATYLFKEDGAGYKGKRLYLKMVREEEDTELLQSLRRRKYPDKTEEAKFLVFFELIDELPLIGAGR